MTDRVKVASPFCRILASAAWLVTGYVFLWGVAGAWGEISPGFLVWTIVAVPVAMLTWRWFVQLGYRISRIALFVLATLWVALCIVSFATARPLVPEPIQLVLALFTAIVTLFGVIVSAFAREAHLSDAH